VHAVRDESQSYAIQLALIMHLAIVLMGSRAIKTQRQQASLDLSRFLSLYNDDSLKPLSLKPRENRPE